jgi:predicted Rossmann-fold nucleotide-binding protein
VQSSSIRKPQVCILGSAEPGSAAYELAGNAGALLAHRGITVVSGCGSPATRVAAEKAVQAGGLVVSIVPPDQA